MLKSLYLPALAVIIAFVGLAMTDSNAEYICGDANSDGSLNVSDAIYIANYVFMGGPMPDPGCCGIACGGMVTDYDGNFYRTVLIGDQCWMMDNLKVTHYRNGDTIPNVTDAGEWHDFATGAFCEFNNDPVNVDTYGRLYNWYAVTDGRNIAPEGWHVATLEEWQTLAMYLGGDAVAGGKLKVAGTAFWMSPNTGATNESGFTALPGGYRDGYGGFVATGTQARFWTSTTYGGADFGEYLYVVHDNAELLQTWLYARFGLSIRCVKD
ncbi:MAG TPA: hypothetical protein ENO22_14635 [candidate division Zixibacteria bacterium]|nr:hypothetical protein [candidate division Zixibacteria bacterium]